MTWCRQRRTEQLIQPDRPQLAFHDRLLVSFVLSLSSGGGLIRALGVFTWNLSMQKMAIMLMFTIRSASSI
jgi:hypothetical protein